jgi:DNA-directed RNA polymerase subunit E'/Rpb7
MTHNQFDIYKEIIEPIKKFIDSNKIIMDKNFPNEIKNEEINKYIKIQKSIRLKIESEIFNIDEFEISDADF